MFIQNPVALMLLGTMLVVPHVAGLLFTVTFVGLNPPRLSHSEHPVGSAPGHS